MTSSDYVVVGTAIDKLYSVYLDFGLEMARKQDWGAVIEELVIDAYYPDSSNAPTGIELAKVYNYVSATTVYADISKGAEYLLAELSKVFGNGLADNKTTDYQGE